MKTCYRIASVRAEAEPPHRLAVVELHPAALLIHTADCRLRIGVARLCSLHEILEGQLLILADTLPGGVQSTEGSLSICISLLGGEGKPLSALLVIARSACSLDIEEAERSLSSHMTLLS